MHDDDLSADERERMLALPRELDPDDSLEDRTGEPIKELLA